MTENKGLHYRSKFFCKTKKGGWRGKFAFNHLLSFYFYDTQFEGAKVPSFVKLYFL